MENALLPISTLSSLPDSSSAETPLAFRPSRNEKMEKYGSQRRTDYCCCVSHAPLLAWEKLQLKSEAIRAAKTRDVLSARQGTRGKLARNGLREESTTRNWQSRHMNTKRTCHAAWQAGNDEIILHDFCMPCIPLVDILRRISSECTTCLKTL